MSRTTLGPFFPTYPAPAVVVTETLEPSDFVMLLHNIQAQIESLRHRICTLERQNRTVLNPESVAQPVEPIDLSTSEPSMPDSNPTNTPLFTELPTSDRPVSIRDPVDTPLQQCGHTAAACAATHGTEIVEELLEKFSGEERGTRVYNFVRNIECTANWHGPKAVAYHLPRALTGKARAWFYNYDCLAETQTLREDLPSFKAALIDRFGLSCLEAMERIRGECYTYKDARDRRDPAEYVRTIMHLGELATWGDELALQTAWIQIAPGLRQYVLQPYKGMPVEEFIRTLDGLKRAWFEHHMTHAHCDFYCTDDSMPPEPSKAYLQRRSDSRRRPPNPYGSASTNARNNPSGPRGELARDEDPNTEQRPPVPVHPNPQRRSYPPSYTQGLGGSRHNNASKTFKESPPVHGQHAHSPEPISYRIGPHTLYSLTAEYFNSLDVERDGIPPFGCGFCGLTYGSFEGIKAHAKQWHDHNMWT